MSLAGFETLDLEQGDTSLRACLRAPSAAHPLFDGHFEGDPLVPAFVQLALVEALLVTWLGARVARLEGVRFRAPLRPDAELAVTLQRSRDGGTFAMGTGDATCATGRFALVAAVDQPRGDAP